MNFFNIKDFTPKLAKVNVCCVCVTTMITFKRKKNPSSQNVTFTPSTDALHRKEQLSAPHCWLTPACHRRSSVVSAKGQAALAATSALCPRGHSALSPCAPEIHRCLLCPPPGEEAGSGDSERALGDHVSLVFTRKKSGFRWVSSTRDFCCQRKPECDPN